MRLRRGSALAVATAFELTATGEASGVPGIEAGIDGQVRGIRGVWPCSLSDERRSHAETASTKSKGRDRMRKAVRMAEDALGTKGARDGNA